MLAIDDIVERVRAERGWSAGAAAEYGRAYLEFLSSAGTGRRPDNAVDAIWHAHILWTRRYRRDCEALVGHFVDHEPDPLVPGKCTAPEQPGDIAGMARCTEPESAPPAPPPTDIARCTDSEPPPDLMPERTLLRRTVSAIGS